MQDQILAVQRMQDYIEDHLKEAITLGDLAKAALFSPWYARRLFLECTKMTPSDYIRRLRLAKSALLLRDGKQRILDVALDMGFGSVDGYQRAFVREFGRNPGEYARDPGPLYLFTPYGVKFQHSERSEVEMTNVKSVFLQIMEKPERIVIIKRGVTAADYWTYCQEVGCDVWGLLLSMKSLGEPVSLWLPQEYRKPGTSEYVQGVEMPADYDGVIPDGFDVIRLPKASYLMFQGEPFEEADFESAIGEIWEAEKKYQPSIIGYDWDPENPRIQLEPVGTRGYIELLPIKPR